MSQFSPPKELANSERGRAKKEGKTVSAAPEMHFTFFHEASFMRGIRLLSLLHCKSVMGLLGNSQIKSTRAFAKALTRNLAPTHNVRNNNRYGQ